MSLVSCDHKLIELTASILSLAHLNLARNQSYTHRRELKDSLCSWQQTYFKPLISNLNEDITSITSKPDLFFSFSAVQLIIATHYSHYNLSYKTSFTVINSMPSSVVVETMEKQASAQRGTFQLSFQVVASFYMNFYSLLLKHAYFICNELGFFCFVINHHPIGEPFWLIKRVSVLCIHVMIKCCQNLTFLVQQWVNATAFESLPSSITAYGSAKHSGVVLS